MVAFRDMRIPQKVTMEDMPSTTQKAVRRGVKDAMLGCGIAFLSCHQGKEKAVFTMRAF